MYIYSSIYIYIHEKKERASPLPPPRPPPGYHHNGFLATHVLQQLWHMMYVHQVHKYMSYHKAIVVITRSGHCFHDNV